MVTGYKKDFAGWQTTQLRGKKKKKKRIQGFPQAIKNVTPSYFRRRIEEK